jgi:hypothetical protein
VGICNYLYIGPYAEWRRPATPGDPVVPPEAQDAWERVVWDGPLHYQNYYGTPPEEEIGGRPHRCYRLLPTLELEGGPARRMVFVDKGGMDVGVLDLTDADRDAELRWFADSYRDRLADLAGGFGTPPAIRWGLLTWRA